MTDPNLDQRISTPTFGNSQIEQLKQALTTALTAILGKECPFVFAFVPPDQTITVCTANVAVVDALQLANDIVAELEKCNGIMPGAITTN
jgi:hypothetical protein